MIVGRSTFAAVLEKLKTLPLREISLDTETTGLRPWHGDRLFSLILGVADEEFYFNFQAYPGLSIEFILAPGHYWQLHEALFTNPSYLWFIHRAQFDMAMLAQEGTELAGPVHCTQAVARVERNDHFTYSLESCAERIGEKKDDSVLAYIVENKLWDWISIPGKKARKKDLHFDRVPFEVIAPYGLQDARVGYRVGQHQKAALAALAATVPEGLPTVLDVAENERRLTKTLFRMEKIGLKIDRPFCSRAAVYESDRGEKAAAEFEVHTGQKFSASGKLFASVFADEKDKWELTDKSNPSFESDVLKKFTNPAAKSVLDYRDAKSRADFYQGFLYHADDADRVHPTLNAGGTGTGRLSSSDPNFQNLTDEEGSKEEFLVRRAIVPTEGYILASLDFDQMEYRQMLVYAKETGVIAQVLGGMDVHQATAELMYGKTDDVDLAAKRRKWAKTLNFMLLYGGGAQKLADALGITLEEAKRLKRQYFDALPGVEFWISNVLNVARTRGYVRNWIGRRSYFPDPEFAYKAPNYLIQGGCADVVKIAMNRIDEFLLAGGYKSRMILQIHDELVFEIFIGEEHLLHEIKQIMECVFPRDPLPLTVGVAVSSKSLADLEKWAA